MIKEHIVTVQFKVHSTKDVVELHTLISNALVDSTSACLDKYNCNRYLYENIHVTVRSHDD